MNLRKLQPTLQLTAAILLIVVGCGLLICGFFIPPPGEIHNSVLVAFGEILTFSGALFGIDYHYKYSLPSRPHNDEPSKPDNDATHK